MDAYIEACLGLCRVAAQGERALLKLLKVASPVRVWRADASTLRSWGVSASVAARFAKRRDAYSGAETEAAMKAGGLWFVPVGADLYPPDLMDLDAPPAGLFIRGTEEKLRDLLARPRLTMVGTRKASPYGLAAAASFAAGFGRSGIAVVSGLALGIDGQAHRGCLRAGGLTAAVLGCGADVVYPRYHRRLYADVEREGLLLSELPPGTLPAPWHFPERNRIMAALGDALLVAEAGFKSGAMGTADWSLRLGRQVMSVPGPILGESYKGCNELIYDGATPALDPDRAVEDFLRETRNSRGRRGAGLTASMPRPPAEGLGPVERLLTLALANGTLSVDQLADVAGVNVREAAAALCRLELRGEVARAGPGSFGLVS